MRFGFVDFFTVILATIWICIGSKPARTSVVLLSELLQFTEQIESL